MKFITIFAMVCGWVIGVHAPLIMVGIIFVVATGVLVKTLEKTEGLEQILVYISYLLFLGTMCISGLMHSDITIIGLLDGIGFLFTGSN